MRGKENGLESLQSEYCVFPAMNGDALEMSFPFSLPFSCRGKFIVTSDSTNCWSRFGYRVFKVQKSIVRSQWHTNFWSIYWTVEFTGKILFSLLFSYCFCYCICSCDWFSRKIETTLKNKTWFGLMGRNFKRNRNLHPWKVIEMTVIGVARRSRVLVVITEYFSRPVLP